MDDDLQSLNSSHQQSEISQNKRKSEKRSKEDQQAASAALAQDKKKMKVLKDAFKDLKQQNQILLDKNKALEEKSKQTDSEMNQLKAKNQELFDQNHALYDNIALLQQKITDELQVQISNKTAFENEKLNNSKVQSDSSLKNIIQSPLNSAAGLIKKQGQGQGGGAIALKKNEEDASKKGMIPIDYSTKIQSEEELKLKELEEEQELIDQMNATNNIAVTLIQQETENQNLRNTISEFEIQIEQKDIQISSMESLLQVKDAELVHIQALLEEQKEKIQLADSRENQIYELVNQKKKEIDGKIGDIEILKKQLVSKDEEIVKLNKQILKIKDKYHDMEAKVEERDGKDKSFKEEIITLQDTIKGKDAAIKHLSDTIMQNANENSRLAEMVSYFKNKLILENCFNLSFAVTKQDGSSFACFKQGQELSIGFIRDRDDQDEFFLLIESKFENNKTGKKDYEKIYVDDIDQIKHIEGTLKFQINFLKKIQKSKTSQNTFGKLLKKKLMGSHKEEDETEECSEIFESKYVKQIIEAFNNVLEVMEQQEIELNQFVGYHEEKEKKLNQEKRRQMIVNSDKSDLNAQQKEPEKKFVVENYIDKVKKYEPVQEQRQTIQKSQKKSFAQQNKNNNKDDVEYEYDEEEYYIEDDNQ